MDQPSTSTATAAAVNKRKRVRRQRQPRRADYLTPSDADIADFPLYWKSLLDKGLAQQFGLVKLTMPEGWKAKCMDPSKKMPERAKPMYFSFVNFQQKSILF